jgi:hypothetical protein
VRLCFVLTGEILERLAGEPEIENIVLGTGTLARDMQRKLRLLGLKAPFLVGGKDDPENGVLGPESLASLENHEKYRFISCFDMDEFALVATTHAIVYRLLGALSNSHPRFLLFSAVPLMSERAPELRVDPHVHNVRPRNGSAYIVYGNPSDEKALKIHLMGSCTVSSVYSHAERFVPELLWEKLRESGLGAVVYSWGQARASYADNLILFLRDVRLHNPDIVILAAQMSDLNPAKKPTKNTLAVNNYYNPHFSVHAMKSVYPGQIGNGINHDIAPPLLAAVRHRIFSALSRQFGFAFWHVVNPGATTMSERQSSRLTGLSPGYLAREREMQGDALKAIGSSQVKDYSNIFDGVEDIFSIFSDLLHYTGKGNDILAQKLADDILDEFAGQKNKYGGSRGKTS